MKKIYSFAQGIDALPAAAVYVDQTFRLPALSGIERSLDQIIWHVRLFDLASGAKIPLQQNNIVDYYLDIWHEQGNIANIVDTIALTGVSTGDFIMIAEPGLYCFNGLLTTNDIWFTFYYRNIDPVAIITVEWSMVIETFEKRI